MSKYCRSDCAVTPTIWKTWHARSSIRLPVAGIDPVVEFRQFDTGLAKTHPGTGLGLALTKRLVQTQGGQVGVTSQHGAGSVF
jgi:signal transduction histidine kinase